ncbi:MAG TPA: WD40 repeat domain-containing serine/threonine-protein kinase [Kofleriaceae bacterium]|jgi:WD40 repeat protein|nr:WD40 repeat domain-containing serine/threonine-protein kinase [Kofleriaceae bacterium]
MRADDDALSEHLSALPVSDLGANGDYDPNSSLSPSTFAEPAVAAGRVDDRAQPQFAGQQRNRRRYKFLGEHGRGGIGRVQRAHDRDLGRDVAIKELLSPGTAHEARFLREVEITARLEHPGIVPVHEAGRWPDGTPFYAMKLVSGRPLRDLLDQHVTREARLDLLHHVIAVADAIAYAHQRQIIHRDLKPANIIVGDFGETVVIDWGLAKDLTRSDEPAAGSGSRRVDANDELTVDGAVLGTPAYMAPEQKYGQPVDQRADVYAIGMMLWELCSLQRVPPAESRVRRRMLRAADIDGDLATIIDKALQFDPDRRYPDAGALASDLKAFKSGARIAARNYSLLALLVHWTRHHRSLALFIVAAILLGLVGNLLYVHNVSAARDRADASGAAAAQALDKLTLKNAQLLLATDPSASVDALADYYGTDRARAEQIRAEARARGVATLRALPHTEAIFWIEVAPDDAILSLSRDGTITRTALDGTTTVLVHGVSKIAIPAYSAARQLLAYTCDPADICMFDLARSQRIAPAALHDLHPSSVAFSPDDHELAVMSPEHGLQLFDITEPAHPVLRLARLIPGGSDVTFIDDTTPVVLTSHELEFSPITGEPRRFAAPGFADWATNPSEHQLVFAAESGQALLFEDSPLRLSAQAELCRGPLETVRFIAGRHELAYACRTGAVGLWDPKRGVITVRAQLDGHTDGLVTSPAGDYLFAAGGNGTIMVIDLQSDLVTSYKGHEFRVITLRPPSAEHPFLITGDVHGGLRMWPLPPRVARVIATSSSQFQSAIKIAGTTLATTWMNTITAISSAGHQDLAPHEIFNSVLEHADTGGVFTAYGLTDLVEVWSSEPMQRTRVIATGHGSITQLAFIAGSHDFVTSGNDGRLIRWTPAGDKTVLAQVGQPIDRFVSLLGGDAAVFSTTDGALWRTMGDHGVAGIRPAGIRSSRLLAVPTLHTMYVGFADGEVIAVDTASWQSRTILRAGGAIQAIDVTPDAQTLAVASNEGLIHLAPARLAGEVAWTELTERVNFFAFTADDLLVMTGIDGTIWIYSIAERHWLCLPLGTVNLGKTALSADGRSAVAVDRGGRLISIDLDAARSLLGIPLVHLMETAHFH